MNLKISKNELLALEKLCKQDYSIKEIAKELGKKESYASRLAKSLEEKGLVYRNSRRLALSPASHAQSFKSLYQSRPEARIEEWLCGNAIGILVILAFKEQGVSNDIFWKEVPCSKPTTYKVLNRLMAAGVLEKNEKIRVSDKAIEEFANYYANNILLIATSKIQGMKTSIRVRLHAVVRAHVNNAPNNFTQTGISALVSYGLEAMQTKDSYFYINLSGKQEKISIEEAFIHGLLMATLEQGQDKQVLALFLMKNRGKMNVAKLRELARQYTVENELNVKDELATMRSAVDYAEKAV